jgi:hypothetical protein
VIYLEKRRRESIATDMRIWFGLFLGLVTLLVLGMSFQRLPSEGSSVLERRCSTDGGSAVMDDPLPGARPSATGLMTYTLYFPIVFNCYDGQEHLSPFGVQMYDEVSNSRAITLTEEAGIKWVRVPLFWSRVEPANTTPENYNWSYYDTIFSNTIEAGFDLILTIQGNPGWAAIYPGGPIDKVDISEFVEFVVALVERYDGDGIDDALGSPRIRYWEFYNEPDNGNVLYAEQGWGYWGHNGAGYAQMLAAVYGPVKAASAEARVVMGGLAYDWFEDQGGPFVREFLDDVLSNGGGQYFDVMNFHYYWPFGPDWFSYGIEIIGKTNFLRSKLLSYGVEKPFICTESGAWSQLEGGSDEIQSRYVTKLYARSMVAGLQYVIWFTLQDYAEDPRNWGLLDDNLDPKPAYSAYQVLTTEMAGARYKRALTSVETGGWSETEGYLYTFPCRVSSKEIYVVWTNYGEVYRPLTVAADRIRRVDKYGVATVIEDSADGKVDGKVSLTVGPSPLYLEVNP